MTPGVLAFVAIGGLVGFRHAFEPDHLAAVTVLATRERGARSSAQLGVAWGAGHTVSVAMVAVAITLLGIRVPDSFYALFECVVALLLIGVGGTTLWRDARRHRSAPDREHLHVPHAGAGHDHAPAIRSASGAFSFGVAHGLAGSGAVIVLLVAASQSVRAQFGYLLAFGIGTVIGMSVVSLLVGGVSMLAAGRSQAIARGIRLLAAAVSVVVGVVLGWGVVSA
jgi:ABC-type nickel/cobalt efflux system permease component RcnA